MISTITDFIYAVEKYSNWLCNNGCRFNEEGFPIPEKEWYLDKWPDQVVPYRSRNARFIKSKSKTVLCLYCADKYIYPRIDKLFSDMAEYKKYMGVIGSDITVTLDMDIEWQEEILLLNQLYMAVLALNEIKVVQNLRIGRQSTLCCYSSVPHGVMCASGTLGCDQEAEPHDLRYSEKLFFLRPSRVLIYGKSDPLMESQLKYAGVDYRLYRDVHTLYKTK